MVCNKKLSTSNAAIQPYRLDERGKGEDIRTIQDIWQELPRLRRLLAQPNVLPDQELLLQGKSDMHLGTGQETKTQKQGEKIDYKPIFGPDAQRDTARSLN